LIISLLPYLFFQSHALADKDITNFAMAGKNISPIYQEMLANQIDRLRKELIDQKIIQPQEGFVVMGVARDEHQLADEVISHLKRKYPEVNWQSSSDVSFYGIILMNGTQESALSKAGSLIEKGYLIIFAEEPIDASLKEMLKNQGFTIHSELSLFELEYVKNSEGRQMVNLDEPYFIHEIFKQRVREGINPVQAHEAAEQAVKDFRKLKKPKLMVFGKILGQQLEKKRQI